MPPPEEEHNRGQEDGSKDGILERWCHDLTEGTILGQSDAYNAGYENGRNNQPEGEDE